MFKMTKTHKFMKNPTDILRQPTKQKEAYVVPKQIREYKLEIRQFLSQILDFDNMLQDNRILYQLYQKAAISKKDLLHIWSQCIMCELKKFTFKANTVFNLAKNQLQLEKFNQTILIKLNKAVRGVIYAIKQIITLEKWCMCEGSACSQIFNQEFTSKKMKNYVFSNLKFPNTFETTHKGQLVSKISKTYDYQSQQYLFNVQNDSLNFFNINNGKCIQHLNQNKNKKSKKNKKEKEKIILTTLKEVEPIIKHLENLKIQKEERENCCFQNQWLEKLSQKKKKLLQL